MEDAVRGYILFIKTTVKTNTIGKRNGLCWVEEDEIDNKMVEVVVIVSWYKSALSNRS